MMGTWFVNVYKLLVQIKDRRRFLVQFAIRMSTSMTDIVEEKKQDDQEPSLP